LTFGASSSELEELLLEDLALRFKALAFGLGEMALIAGTSVSSSASLSDPLDEEGDPDSFRVGCFLVGTIGVCRSS